MFKVDNDIIESHKQEKVIIQYETKSGLEVAEVTYEGDGDKGFYLNPLNGNQTFVFYLDENDEYRSSDVSETIKEEDYTYEIGKLVKNEDLINAFNLAYQKFKDNFDVEEEDFDQNYFYEDDEYDDHIPF